MDNVYKLEEGLWIVGEVMLIVINKKKFLDHPEVIEHFINQARQLEEETGVKVIVVPEVI